MPQARMEENSLGYVNQPESENKQMKAVNSVMNISFIFNLIIRITYWL